MRTVRVALSIVLLGCCGGLATSCAAVASAQPPALSAPAARLIEADDGAVIYSRNAWQERAIASTTKLMTAYVTLHHASPRRLLTVQPYSPAPEETIAGLVAGQRLSVFELLEAMLLPSGGDAANTLALDLGGTLTRFVGWMNAAARRLGLGRTHYSTPVGLDTPGNYSTAADLARLASALLRDETFARIVDLPRARLRDGLPLLNRNDLVGRFWYVVGIKTGHTSLAGHCLVAAARRGGVSVISVVLGEPSEAARDRDTLALLRYGLALYHRVRVIAAGHVYARVPITGSPGQRLALVAARSVWLPLRRGTRLALRVAGVPRQLAGPLAPRTRLGRIVATAHGRVLARVPLINRERLAPPNPPAPPTVPPGTAEPGPPPA